MERNRNESFEEYFLRGVEHFMSILPEEPRELWHVARPSQAARESTIAFIKSIDWDGLLEPLFCPSLNRGFCFEWNHPAHELYIDINSDGSFEYFTAEEDPLGKVEEKEGVFSLNDGRLDESLVWFNPKTHALATIHKLMDFPLGESTWSPSRPSEAAKDLAIGLILALPWSGLPIPIVTTAGDGSIHFKWIAPRRALQIWITTDLSMEYFADEGEHRKEGNLFAFGTCLSAPISWFKMCEC